MWTTQLKKLAVNDQTINKRKKMRGILKVVVYLNCKLVYISTFYK